MATVRPPPEPSGSSRQQQLGVLDPSCSVHVFRGTDPRGNCHAVSLSSRSTDLVSAALRHVEDAESLLANSPDQGWHLAGFGPECARKACLAEDWLDKLLGHDLAAVSDEILDLALALDVTAARYALRGLARNRPTLARWSVESRYDPTGTHGHDEAEELVKDAADVTRALAADLWMDGRVRIGP